MTRALLTLAFALSWLALPAAAGVVDLDDWKADASGWEAARVGTKVHYRTTRARVVPGMKTPVTSEFETERTLEFVDDGRLVFTTRLKAGANWDTPRKEAEPRPTKGSISVQQDVIERRDSVTVEGLALPCRRVRFVRTRDGVEDDRIVAWISEQHGVLKTQKEASPGNLLTHTVTRLSSTRTVGDFELRCRELSIEAPGTKGRLVVSADVPGRIVEMHVTVEREGARSTVTRTLVGLTVPR